MNDDNKVKRYWYHVSLSAEDETNGWVQLTEDEAKAVDYASHVDNWVCVSSAPWSGSFFIDLSSKRKKKPE